MPSSKPLKRERLALGRRIRDAREAKRLSKAEAARSAGVRVQSWQQWEAGKTSPRPDKLPAIARLLSVSVKDLLEGHFFETAGDDVPGALVRNYKRARDALGPYEAIAAFEPRDLDDMPEQLATVGEHFQKLPRTLRLQLIHLLGTMVVELERRAAEHLFGTAKKQKGAA